MNKYSETFGIDISKPACRQAGMSLMYMVVKQVMTSIRTMKLDLRNSLSNYPKVHWSLWKLPVIIITDLHSFFTKMK